MTSYNYLLNALIYLATAVIMVPLFKRIGLGAVLGYMAGGILIGPHIFGLVSDVDAIFHFSELGVVMLLFIIGLELNPKKLWMLRRGVFGLGGAQVLLTTLVLAGLTLAYNIPLGTAIVIGIALSLSSTAFSVQLLQEHNHFSTEYGKKTFGILLFQDIAVAPIVAILPFISPGGTSGPIDPIYFLRMILAVAVIMILGRVFLRHFFRFVAKAEIPEILTASSLLMVIGMAYSMNYFGVSMGLGSFLAGVLLADSEYRHEIEANVQPFKGLFLGLFFIAVGMSVNLPVFTKETRTIVGLTLALMIVKFVIIFIIGRVSRMNRVAAGKMGVVLAQGGEFAFVILGVASQNALINSKLLNVLSLIVILSMAATPLIFKINENYLKKYLNLDKKYDEINEHNPVIIAGFGRFGQIISRILRLQDIPFTGLEHDSQQVEVTRRFGSKIYYGDASRIDLLRAAGADKAKIFILCIDDMDASLRTAEVVRKNFPNLKIYARARNRLHAFKLMDRGVTLIHRETLGSSLHMAKMTLIELGLSEEMARLTVVKFKEHDEKVLAEQYKIYNDEAKMIRYSQSVADELYQILKADREGSEV